MEYLENEERISLTGPTNSEARQADLIKHIVNNHHHNRTVHPILLLVNPEIVLIVTYKTRKRLCPWRGFELHLRLEAVAAISLQGRL